MTTNNASNILAEAQTVLSNRATQRDCPTTGERSMASTIKAFNALTGRDLSESEGWEFMVLPKAFRKPHPLGLGITVKQISPLV